MIGGKSLRLIRLLFKRRGANGYPNDWLRVFSIDQPYGQPRVIRQHRPQPDQDRLVCRSQACVIDQRLRPAQRVCFSALDAQASIQALGIAQG